MTKGPEGAVATWGRAGPGHANIGVAPVQEIFESGLDSLAAPGGKALKGTQSAEPLRSNKAQSRHDAGSQDAVSGHFNTLAR